MSFPDCPTLNFRGNRKKKTPEKERNDPKTRTLWDAEILGNALKEIENKTFSIRAASRAYGIPKTTLADYISGRCKLGPGRSLRKNPVFSREVEEEMVRYSGVHIWVIPCQINQYSRKLKS